MKILSKRNILFKVFDTYWQYLPERLWQFILPPAVYDYSSFQSVAFLEFFFLCHYIPNTPLKRTFILEPLITKLCYLHWSTWFPFFLQKGRSHGTPSTSRARRVHPWMGASRLPALGSREQLRDKGLENSGEMGSSAFCLLGQYPKNRYNVDFF